jgi:hypothetical protein
MLAQSGAAEGEDAMPSEELLRAYCRAFGARDAQAVAALFADGALYELPLLGQRLVGQRRSGSGWRAPSLSSSAAPSNSPA